MKLGFVVNAVATEQNNYTTVRLAWNAVNAGHEVALIELGDFTYEPSGALAAAATIPSRTSYDGDQAFLDDVQGHGARKVRLSITALDVLMLRANPADEGGRPWAPTSGLLFAQLAAAQGVVVLNDPYHLTDAANKTYFQHFPERVRPLTCITRDPDEIKAFLAARNGCGVIKPLQGSGGQGVFVVRPGHESNVNAMIEAVLRDGYALVQEYLPRAAEGDLRLLMLNGRPLRADGTYACFRRRSNGMDARSNISAGGTIELAEPDDDALAIAEMVGPKLVRDGMYLAGLDVAGDKLMEINVDTPGGVTMAEDLTGVPFSRHLLADLEHKVRVKRCYRGSIDNLTLANL